MTTLSFDHLSSTGLSQRPKRTPLTILSGFLGAGKTTILNQILRDCGPRRIAVVVNDLGEINIDASMIRDVVTKVDGPIGSVVELTSGCICCSIQTELVEALERIVHDMRPDHIVIEATGVADPKSILETIYTPNDFGYAGSDFLQIRNMVTVVDASAVYALIDDSLYPEQRRKWILSSDRRRPLIELLMDQIECADLLVVNKVDLADAAELPKLTAWLQGLNIRAEIVAVEQGRIDVQSLLARNRFDEEATFLGARWRKEMDRPQPDNGQDKAQTTEACCHEDHEHDADCGGDHGHDHSSHHQKDYGLSAIVYRGRKPFVEKKLLQVLREDLPGLLRAKGFFWTREQLDRVGFLSISGDNMRADYIGRWWQVMIAEGDAEEADIPHTVQKNWLEGVGDRRQEIVLIGIDLNEAEIRSKLESCL